MNCNFTTEFQWFDRVKVTHKLLSAMTERSTKDKYNLELFPGLFTLLLLLACSLFIPCNLKSSKECSFGHLPLTHLVAFILPHHIVQITGKPGKVFLLSKDSNCENLLIHPTYFGYQGNSSQLRDKKANITVEHLLKSLGRLWFRFL